MLSPLISSQRQEYKNKKKGKKSRLDDRRIQLLNDIGFSWELQRGGKKRKLMSSQEPDYQESNSDDSSSVSSSHEVLDPVNSQSVESHVVASPVGQVRTVPGLTTATTGVAMGALSAVIAEEARRTGVAGTHQLQTSPISTVLSQFNNLGGLSGLEQLPDQQMLSQLHQSLLQDASTAQFRELVATQQARTQAQAQLAALQLIRSRPDNPLSNSSVLNLVLALQQQQQQPQVNTLLAELLRRHAAGAAATNMAAALFSVNGMAGTASSLQGGQSHPVAGSGNAMSANEADRLRFNLANQLLNRAATMGATATAQSESKQDDSPPDR